MNLVLLAPSMLIQSSQDMSSGTSESENTSWRISVARTLRMPRPSLNIILFLPQDAIAIRSKAARFQLILWIGRSDLQVATPPGYRSAGLGIDVVSCVEG